MKLPDGFVEEWTAKGKGAVIFGVPIEDLTKDELFAVAVAGWHAYSQQLNRSMQALENIRSLNKWMG